MLGVLAFAMSLVCILMVLASADVNCPPSAYPCEVIPPKHYHCGHRTNDPARVPV